MTELTRNDEEWARGSWRPWKEYDSKQGTYLSTAAVACMSCGRAMTVRNHTISADGTLSPSLVCPHKCGWHVWARLLGWSA